jgi:pimeloyl-ACP methyl ester carboxylesterase
VSNLSALFYAGDEKPVVIALHCSGASGHAWRHLGAALGERFTLIAPDLIDCGAAGPWRGAHAFTVADEAALAIRMIDEIERPVHLVGHSYGGGVALRVARERPSRVASLTLYDPTLLSPLRTIGADGRAALAMIDAIGQAVCAAVASGAYRSAAQRYVDYWGGAGSFAAMTPDAQAAMIRYLPKVCLEYHAVTRENYPLVTFRRFNFPILLLQGEHSPLPFQLIARQLARAMKIVSLRVLHGMGHLGPFTHPDAVAAIMADHVAAAEGGLITAAGGLRAAA